MAGTAHIHLVVVSNKIICPAPTSYMYITYIHFVHFVIYVHLSGLLACFLDMTALCGFYGIQDSE